MNVRDNYGDNGMQLSPENIRKQEFGTALRGYRREEVMEFLQEVARQYDGLLREKQELVSRVSSAEAKLKEYQDRRDDLEAVLLTVQKSARLIDDTSRQRAQLIVDEAEDRSRRIVQEAETRIADLKQELSKLQQQKNLFLRKMRSVLDANADLLDFYEEESIPTEVFLHEGSSSEDEEPAGTRPDTGAQPPASGEIGLER